MDKLQSLLAENAEEGKSYLLIISNKTVKKIKVKKIHIISDNKNTPDSKPFVSGVSVVEESKTGVNSNPYMIAGGTLLYEWDENFYKEKLKVNKDS
jgi:hypothetical protein